MRSKSALYLALALTLVMVYFAVSSHGDDIITVVKTELDNDEVDKAVQRINVYVADNIYGLSIYDDDRNKNLYKSRTACEMVISYHIDKRDLKSALKTYYSFGDIANYHTINRILYNALIEADRYQDAKAFVGKEISEGHYHLQHSKYVMDVVTDMCEKDKKARC